MSGKLLRPTGRVVRSFDDGVVVLRLEDEPVLNALSSQMLADMAREIRAASEDPDVRGVVVIGTGAAFSSGENLRETAALVASRGIAELSRLFNDITEAVVQSRIPCVAALNGVAVGGAAELTLCFDRRVGAPGASFLFPESRMGFTISNAASLLLPALVGRSIALELVLTGRPIADEEALQIGLLDEVVDSPEGLLPRCREFVREVTPKGNTARLHLSLLRPPLAAVRAAFVAEADAAASAWDSGAMHAKIAEFEGP